MVIHGSRLHTEAGGWTRDFDGGMKDERGQRHSNIKIQMKEKRVKVETEKWNMLHYATVSLPPVAWTQPHPTISVPS